jgi:hypothetical protein
MSVLSRFRLGEIRAPGAVRPNSRVPEGFPLFPARDGGDIGVLPTACGSLLDVLPFVKAAYGHPGRESRLFCSGDPYR